MSIALSSYAAKVLRVEKYASCNSLAQTAEVCRKHGISNATFYNLKSEYSGIEVSEDKRLNL